MTSEDMDEQAAAEACMLTPAHQAHMAINGECPWCGAHDPNQTEFLSVEEAVEIWG
jgi:hypothetical protein